MPHKEMQAYVNIDYDKVLSVVAIAEKGQNERIIAEARYAYDKGAGVYEIAFIVDEDFQGKGVATFLFRYLIKIARDRGIQWFVAYVLLRNESMMKVFEKSQLPIERSYENDSLVLRFDLTQAAAESDAAAGK